MTEPTKLMSMSRFRALTMADLYSFTEPWIVHKGSEQLAVLLPYEQYMELQNGIVNLASMLGEERE